MEQIRRWHIYPSADDLVSRAAAAVIRCAEQAIAQRGEFRVVLAGGRTPQAIYRHLRETAADWSRWYVYFGDERCVPVGDPARNDAMAGRLWLDHVALPSEQIFRIPAEQGGTAAAAAYAGTVEPVALFDLVLLGLGEDGHTASLFPGRELGEGADAPMALAVQGAPKPPPERVSLSARRLSASRQVLFLVTGGSKREAVAHWHGGAPVPAARITPVAGVDVLADQEAYD